MGNGNRYRTKSPRLKNWDYSSNGYYFITICTKNKEKYFGEIIKQKMVLSDLGNEAEKCWLQIPEHFPFVILDEYIIMPDHIHGIIKINKPLNDSLSKQFNEFGPQIKNLASIIRGFKIGVTKYSQKSNNVRRSTINTCRSARSCDPTGISIFAWQPRYYDHVIRNKIDLYRIRNYIKNNPMNW